MNQVKANIFLEETPTDGHSPMKFICDDGQVYYCKYRVNHKIEEIDCLIYEVLCHDLLQILEIPTPDIAIVELLSGTFSPKDSIKNKHFAKPGVLCFGSKEVLHSNLITGLEIVNNSESVMSILNPYDLVKIAVFDIWVDNADRGRNENYNLLTSAKNGKLKIWAFDNAFAFGGMDSLRIFNSSNRPSIYEKLVQTNYFRSLIGRLDRNKCIQIVEEITAQFYKIEQIIASTFEQIPSDWKVFHNLKPKINSFLLDSRRIDSVKSLAISQLNKL